MNNRLMSRAVYDMLFSANLRKGVGGQIGKRNNKPNFVALRQAPAIWWGGIVDFCRIVNRRKNTAAGAAFGS